MNTEALLPALSAQEIKEPLYIKGHPRPYRWSGSTGQLLYDDEVICKGSFTLCPVAYRVFEGEIFGRNGTWCELFFFNIKGDLCSVQFHDFSVKRLGRFMTTHLLYEGKDLIDVSLQCSPEKATGKDEAGNPVAFYVMNFSEGDAENDFDLNAMISEPVFNIETIPERGEVKELRNMGVTIPDEVKRLGF